uniref:Uncharacterized protein n=1 Tax=Acrobeloides nanus TaxID=290746 RepID=A0A914E2I3_9BILA
MSYMNTRKIDDNFDEIKHGSNANLIQSPSEAETKSREIWLDNIALFGVVLLIVFFILICIVIAAIGRFG